MGAEVADEKTAFAELLRRHRLTAELTQEALAERAGLSVNAIQKLETGGAHPQRETLRRLVEALQLGSDEQAAFQTAGRPAPRRRTVEERGDAELPTPLTSFIGRLHEKEELPGLLRETRLLTLTGVGGCGKTRLALEVARLVRDRYPDGVRLVELAPLADAALVPQAVATAFGVRETPTQPLVATLAAAVKQLNVLLVLDNCEHVLDTCAQLVDELLRACPNLHILATSRETLGVIGEVSRAVPSLDVPPLVPPPTVEQVARSDAAQLFLARASAYQSDFALTERNVSAIAHICALLDGIPLALELAAALVRGLAVEDIATRLDQRFRLLSSGGRALAPRHQTLRATIDWSFDLLTLAERSLFARLSVFSGRWLLEDIEEVCVGQDVESDDVLGLVVRLVEKSLLVAETRDAGSHRYRLLETLREYGLERLRASGELEAVQERHARHYLALAERAESELNGPLQATWIERLGIAESDLLAALDWWVSRRDMPAALRLAGVLGRCWAVRGQVHEGRRRLAAILALPGAEAATLDRARVLEQAGVLAQYQADETAARQLFKESLSLYRLHSDQRGIAWVLMHLAWLSHQAMRNKAARRFAHEALQLCRELHDRRGQAMCLTVLGLVVGSEGGLDEARSLHEEAVALSRQVGDRWATAWALTNLGIVLFGRSCLGELESPEVEGVMEEARAIWVELGEQRHLAFVEINRAKLALLRGRYAVAQQLLEESLAIFVDLDDRGGAITNLSNWGQLFGTLGGLEHEVRLLAASYGQLRPSGRFWSFWAELQEQRLDTARRALGEDRFEAAWAEGYAMSLETAVEYARSVRASLVASGSLR